MREGREAAVTIFHCHIAVSLDGCIARPDGSVDGLDAHPPQPLGRVPA
jgi:hypothetical protein